MSRTKKRRKKRKKPLPGNSIIGLQQNPVSEPRTGNEAQKRVLEEIEARERKEQGYE